jgi:hypothetical protein
MIVSRWRAAALIGAGALLVPSAAAVAQAQDDPAPPAQPAPYATPQQQAAANDQAQQSGVEPQALKALTAMTAYLRSIPSFEVNATTTRDIVSDNGQKLQFGGTANYKVRRPDRFVAEVNEDRKARTIIYDGRMLTVFAPRNQVYARVPAPPTIRETVAMAEQRYDLHPPLLDLFRWGAGESATNDLVSGFRVGYARIRGQDTDQYAFRQNDGTDFQIWLTRSNNPVPLKVVITSTDIPGAPQFTANLDWNVNPTFAASTFDFRPPPGSQQIAIAAAQ